MLPTLGLICLGLAWLVPNHYPPWSSFYNDSLAGVGLALLTAASWRACRRSGSPRAAWVIVGLAAVPWLQWSFGRVLFVSDALVASLYLLGLAVAVTVGFARGPSGKPSLAATLPWTVVAAALVSSILAMLQGLGVSGLGIWSLDPITGMRAYANLGQPNNLATLLGWGAVALLSLREQGRLSPLAAASLLVPLLIASAMTQSRTALLFGPLILLMLAWARRRGVPLHTGSLIVAAFWAAHGLLMLLWPYAQGWLDLSATQGLAERGVDTPRLAVWRILADALSEVPWAGYGWLQTGAAQLAAADRHAPVGEMWLQGHNIFVDLLVWCGYPLGLALSAILLYWYVDRVRRISDLCALTGMLFISLLGAHSMLELPHHYAYFLIPVGLWIGQVEKAEGNSRPLASNWWMAPAAAALVFLGLVWRDYPSVEEDFRLVRFESLRIGAVHSTASAPDAPFHSGLTAFLRFARTNAEPGMSAQQLADMDRIVQRYPYASSMARYARALVLNGRIQQGQRLFREIRHIHGQKMYDSLVRDVRERIEQGETGLRPLLVPAEP